MNFRETLEDKKKPIILAIAVIVLVIVVIVVFVPFGGDNVSNAPVRRPVVARKAAIKPPAEAPVDIAKVEVPAAAPDAGAVTAKPEAMPAQKGAVDMKPVPGPAMKTPTATQPAPAKNGAARMTAKPVVKPMVEPVTAPANSTTKRALVKKLTKRWAVNTGSFSSRNEAKKFAKKLSEAGYDNVYITEFKKDDSNWHRVRVGFYATRDEARRVESELGAKFNIDTPWAVRPTIKEISTHSK